MKVILNKLIVSSLVVLHMITNENYKAGVSNHDANILSKQDVSPL